MYINVYIQLCAAMDGAANVLGIKCVKLETCGRHHCTSCLILNKYLGFLGKKTRRHIAGGFIILFRSDKPSREKLLCIYSAQIPVK